MTYPKAIAAALAESRRSMLPLINELRGLPVSELAARYEQLFGKPPRCRHRVWLWKRCAWKLQEQRSAGLSEVAKAKLEALIAEIDLPLEDRARTVTGVLIRPRRPGTPAPGTVLTRTWRGQQISVRVLEGGACEWNGVRYRSLTAAARAISGAHWSGPLFFGLRKQAKGAA
jgi:Protein of unknown function (DUF2924)